MPKVILIFAIIFSVSFCCELISEKFLWLWKNVERKDKSFVCDFMDQSRRDDLETPRMKETLKNN